MASFRNSVRRRVPLLTPHTAVSLTTVPSGISGFLEPPILKSGRIVNYLVAKNYSAYARVNNAAGYSSSTTVIAIDGMTVIDDTTGLERAATADDILNLGLASKSVTFGGGATAESELTSRHDDQYSISALTLTQLTLSGGGLASAVVDNEKMYFHTLNNRDTDFELLIRAAFENKTVPDNSGQVNTDATAGSTTVRVSGASFSALPPVGIRFKFSNHSQIYTMTATSADANPIWTISPALEQNVTGGATNITVIETCNDGGIILLDNVGVGTEKAIMFLVHRDVVKLYGLQNGTFFDVNHANSSPVTANLLLQTVKSAFTLGVNLNENAGNWDVTLFQNGQQLTYSGTVGTSIDLVDCFDAGADFYQGAAPNAAGFYVGFVSGVIDALDEDGGRMYMDSLDEYQP